MRIELAVFDFTVSVLQDGPWESMPYTLALIAPYLETVDPRCRGQIAEAFGLDEPEAANILCRYWKSITDGDSGNAAALLDWLVQLGIGPLIRPAIHQADRIVDFINDALVENETLLPQKKETG